MIWLRSLAAVLISACILLPVFGQGLDEDFPPGMLARYTAGERTVERIDPDVAFVWGAAAPDPRLPAGEFGAEWTSLLLVRSEGQYRFHAYLQGDVTVEVGGKTVLAASSAQPGWIRGDEVPVAFGEQPLKVRFHKTQKNAELRLFWSSDSFRLEPIPSYLLYREEPQPDLARIELGRKLYEAHRCNRCHRRENEPPSAAAPALTHLATGTAREWLVTKILGPHEAARGARMPLFGHTREEAEAIAAYLTRHSETVKLKEPSRPKDADEERRAGEVLFRSIGCLACHTAGEHGSDGPFGGGDLAEIGSKRTAGWLDQWLRDPARLNTDHRMPVFKLSDKERKQLVLYLSSLGHSSPPLQKGGPGGVTASGSERSESPPLPPPSEGGEERGRKLIEVARCAACHRIPGIAEKPPNVPELSREKVDWERSCLAEEPDRRTNRPAYRGIDREAVVAFVESRAGTLSPPSLFEQGRALLDSRNCLACHERDRSKGIVPIAGAMARLDTDLQGRSEAMIPPALTAVGDKLRDDALAEAVQGKQASRMPWLHVRMPEFRHSESEQSALLAYLIGHDRIPDGVVDSPREPKQPLAEETDHLLVAGHTLMGAKGFSCIACHKVREYEPKDVALGTRGSDLWMLGRRMRKEFYLRWVEAPQRIIPGMEMPGYKRPVPGVLDGDLDAQLLATWAALNDPRFTAPTNPTSVEQFFTVEPGQPARIIRDVFTLPREKGSAYVARAMAIGMNNGHSILFDLDTFSMRQWTVGDFARQRTQGKSWYWDMAGVPVMTIQGETSDLVLVSSNGAAPIEPLVRNRTSGRLVEYHPDGDGVEFSYDLNLEIGGREQAVRVVQTFSPCPPESSQRGGWTRRITVADVPSGFVPLLRARIAPNALGEPSVEDEPAKRIVTGQDVALTLSGERRYDCTVAYRCSIARDDLPSPPAAPAVPLQIEHVTSMPGYAGVRLPLDRSIMPTAMTWTTDGTLAFASLKGQVFLAHDTDGDGLEDKLTLFEEGLAAPYGIIPDGDDLLVSHKPELLRLRDTDGDGRADLRKVIATGWGYCDNYHDWTCGIIRDSQGNMYVGLGSDYSQPDRQRETSLWRGKVLRIAPDGQITPVAHAFRFPTGLAITPDDQIFVTDNQGVQNTFNEINHLVEGRRYGVPSRFDEQPNAPAAPPAIQVPHPWSRSVNGVFFLPQGDGPFAGHGVGCEYNYRFLVRFTLQKVGGEYQGAVYPFSHPDPDGKLESFLGPLCGGVAPNGDLYIGCIYDSGWLGGRNTGEIVRLRPNGKVPNGIREVRATHEGFEIDFIHPVDANKAAEPKNYTVSGYTRVWEGAYATPDSGRHQAEVTAAEVSPNGDSVRLTVADLRAGHVYEVTCGNVGTQSDGALWPATGHYTLHRIPERGR